MPDAIARIEQATPAWLTDVLRCNGRLSLGEVRSLTVTGVHDRQLYSVGYYLAASYSSDAPGASPTRLFLKIPRSGPDIERNARIGESEVRMYRVLASDQRDLPVILCYDAVYDPDKPGYHLLLDDLSATHEQPTWHLTISDFHIMETVDCLASFHAYWWERPQLGNGMGALPNREGLADEIARLQDGYAGFSRYLNDRLSAEDRTVFETVLTSLPALWTQRTERRGQTLVHGDAHFWNFLYPLDPRRHRTYMLDWQCYHIAPGTDDLAYTLALRYPHRTLANERDLVRRYYNGLCGHGIASYAWEDCWLDYRRSVVERPLDPLRWWIGNLPEDFWGTFVPRAMVAFRDLNCADLLGL